jgi:hypothetical protein
MGILHGNLLPFGQNALNLDALFVKRISALRRVAGLSFMQNYIEMVL